MKRTLIKVIDVCTSHQMEIHFVRQLSESGLIDIVVYKDEEFLDEEQLQPLEQYATWHYDLDINIQGIEVAQQLLLKIEQLQEEVNRLR
ncbi:chaperone modulator CbpM [Sphingobacterium psychroaquaticum]|uniref:MerR HTH family regulatory protein n=1 Tax=Sphingobacterium psychroaquaticum TaxID=561061 RepID=A0A1X7J6K2_9SPHI|nr:chaperone modulator CbpM [Sphingobacterium psychroaquaticum]QBQ40089.1 hypothetical protein E2P86_02540 [Sphingobacterium psychroaquaticum]SMG22568.1 MerR HTH family regulatory protein [Sphingobacterium psychroaquaticum]